MRAAVVVIGGVLAGILAVLLVAAVAGDGDEPEASDPSTIVELRFPAVAHDIDAAEGLIVAWNRWRTASFVTTGTWSRTPDGGADPLNGETFTAQDPPRRLVVRLGTVIESIEGSVTVCDAPSEDVIVPGCQEVGGVRSYDERVADEMQLVVEYVVGDARLYDVGFDDVDNPFQSCFRVELREQVLRSPWGRAARFCFDDETGALASTLVRRQSAVDEEITAGFRTDVRDTDFLQN
ncbi:MAG: hypothetical protein AAF548_00155 [Actinomycetota bacterium]